MNKYAKKLVEILNARGVNNRVVREGHQTMIETHLMWTGTPKETQIPMVVTTFAFAPESSNGNKPTVTVSSFGYISSLFMGEGVDEIDAYKVANEFNEFHSKAPEYVSCVIPSQFGDTVDVRRQISFSGEDDLERIADELDMSEAAYHELFEFACQYFAENQNGEALSTSILFLQAVTGSDDTSPRLLDEFEKVKKNKRYFSELELKRLESEFDI